MQEQRLLPSGLPHVAYILLWYPLFTQPFIFREVEELRQRLPLTVYSLYGRNLRHCSQAMQRVAPQTRMHGIAALPRFVAAFFREGIRAPRRLFSLMRRCLWHRWPSWEIFGENLWAFFAGVYFARLFREEGIDALYAPWPRGTATAAFVASSLSGIPFATSARGDNLDPKDPDLVMKLNAASFIRANNAADKARIEALIGVQHSAKIGLIYNGLPLPLPQEKDRAHPQLQSPIRLLALGRFDVTKGFDVLLHACALLKKHGLDFRLTLAGGGGKALGLGALETRLRALCTELQLDAYVQFPGLVSHDVLPQLLREHDMFLAPCVVDPASGKRDGIPNTVIEALSYGLPVIATSVNALPEVVIHEQTGLIVPPHDPTALAEAVLRLVEHPDFARQLGTNAAVFAQEKFSPEKNSILLAQHIQSMVQQHRGAGACVE